MAAVEEDEEEREGTINATEEDEKERTRKDNTWNSGGGAPPLPVDASHHRFLLPCSRRCPLLPSPSLSLINKGRDNSPRNGGIPFIATPTQRTNQVVHIFQFKHFHLNRKLCTIQSVGCGGGRRRSKHRQVMVAPPSTIPYGVISLSPLIFSDDIGGTLPLLPYPVKVSITLEMFFPKIQLV